MFPVRNSTSKPPAVKNKEQICSPCVATKTLLHGRERAQYAPVSDKGKGATVCSQSWYEWKPSSPSCAHAGPPCTSLECKRLLSHWTGTENNLLNGLHTMTVIVGEKERTLLEHRQTWKHAASITTLWPSLTSPLCHCIFEADLVSSHLQVPVRATAGLRAASLMTGLIPYTLCRLRIREPCSSLSVCTLTASA